MLSNMLLTMIDLRYGVQKRTPSLDQFEEVIQQFEAARRLLKEDYEEDSAV